MSGCQDMTLQNFPKMCEIEKNFVGGKGARCVLGAPLDPRHYLQQECIPVGCIPSAGVAVLGRGVST